MLLFPEDLLEPSLHSLHFVEAGEEKSAVDALKNGPLRLGEIDGRSVLDETDLLAAIAQALALPRYFSGSFNALVDCLRDEGVSPRGFVLVVRDASSLWRRAPVVAGSLVEAWLDGVAGRRSAPLHLVFVWSERAASQSPPA
jgi:hypothetical protein